jgi:hypothetical protein
VLHSTAGPGRSAFRKIAAGIVRNVSVGYRVHNPAPIGADAGTASGPTDAKTTPCEFIEEKIMDEDDTKSGTKSRSAPVRQAFNGDRGRLAEQARIPGTERVVSKAVDTTSWPTHTEAADTCRVSYNTIKNWVKQGWLHPQRALRKQANGAYREMTVFDPVELAKMARRKGTAFPNDPGELTARAFELFDEGKTLREVVIIVRAELQRIEELHDQWSRCGGSELVITPFARQELERLIGGFEGVADLVQRVSALATTTKATALGTDGVVTSG